MVPPMTLSRFTTTIKPIPKPKPKSTKDKKAAQNFEIHEDGEELTSTYKTFRDKESISDIYLDLSKQPGVCILAPTGLGWKREKGDNKEKERWTLDPSNIGGAQWSRAARGYEIKIQLRNQLSGIVQLDGFKLEVTNSSPSSLPLLTYVSRTLSASPNSSKTGTALLLKTRSIHSADGTGARESLEKPSSHSTSRTDPPSNSRIPRSKTQTWLARTKSPSNSCFQTAPMILPPMILLMAMPCSLEEKARELG